MTRPVSPRVLVLLGIVVLFSFSQLVDIETFTGKHVSVVDQLQSAQIFSLSDQYNSSQDREDNIWKHHNRHTLSALLTCLLLENCRPNQDKLVILEDWDYMQAYSGTPGGERIWSRSVLRTFDLLGISYAYARDLSFVQSIYSMFPNQTKAILLSQQDLEACWNDWGCVMDGKNTLGLPIELLYSAQFFGHKGGNPFGAKWTITPEKYDYTDPETYIGYSIEEECAVAPIIPHHERPKQVWVLGKHTTYLSSSHFPYSRDIFQKASAKLGVEFVGAFDSWNGEEASTMPGLRNLLLAPGSHHLNKEEFEQQLKNSLAIVGLHDPLVSPTPWYGLCFGTPFINPAEISVDGQGHSHVRDSQHFTAGALGEPHVYNVERYNDEAFISNLRRAIQPHDRFIPPFMRQSVLSRRVLDWIDSDKKSLLQKRIASDEKWLKVLTDKWFLKEMYI
ncbi:hypothetical protein [Phaffia rhodozyma]|uniref:Alpha-1,6-mannosyl-glycoprotein 6-beta-N-acetylglucosaminyltransferase n=1 Tax=Phaffia rhodozyma TaxID=264483 RepID=A0A0F7SSC9_PHARH|nr:hypothetical protein [Phaffia rhodozyma]